MSRLILHQPRRAYMTYASLMKLTSPRATPLSNVIEAILPCWGVPEHAFVCRWDDHERRQIRLDIVPQGYDLAADGRTWEEIPLEDWSPAPEGPHG